MDQEMESKKGQWTPEEDLKLKEYIGRHGKGRWESWDFVARNSGLIGRSGSSCRLRWYNHLNPDIQQGDLTHKERLLILKLRSTLGRNQWSEIAKRLHWRTDNQIKNFWHTKVKRKAEQQGCNVDVFQKRMMETMIEKIQLATTAAGDVGGYSHKYEADIDALLASLFPDGIGGAAATLSPPSFTTNAAAIPTLAYSSTTIAYNNIGAAFASPSDIDYPGCNIWSRDIYAGPSFSSNTTADEAKFGAAFVSPSDHLP